MRIGFVSTWLERGATYVTKSYMELLSEHDLFVYARGGEKYERNNPKFDKPFVTWGLRLGSTVIDFRHFSNWIIENQLDAILFNEQTDLVSVLKTKYRFPRIKLGAYIDYYTEDTVDDFKIYDFLICNTKRHYSVFEWHKEAHYVPWGTDLELFNFNEKDNQSNEINFFHSMGMSQRKGTDILIKAFIKGEFYKKKAKLIIHSQLNLDYLISIEEAEKYNIQLIVKEVPPPGLYHLGDVYVYPTTLEGLGLTIYEAMACGLPVITTDNAPMNEVITKENGRVVEVDSLRTRKDGYYWPLAFVNKASLIENMNYYCDNRDKIKSFQNATRNFAIKNLDIRDRRSKVVEIFEKDYPAKFTSHEIDKWIKNLEKKQRVIKKKYLIELLIPKYIKHIFRGTIEKKRFDSR